MPTLECVFRFEDSWTNVFLNAQKNALFISGTEFNNDQKMVTRGNKRVSLLHPVALTQDNINWNLIDYVRESNRVNPDMTYKVPVDYDNTVKGLIARMCGEVARLDKMPKDHFIHDVADAMKYHMVIERVDSEINTLTTPINLLQGGGSGIMPSDNPFYNDTEWALHVFGMLEYDFQTLMENPQRKGSWVPSGPSALGIRLLALKDEQAALLKRYKKEQGDAYVFPWKAQTDALLASMRGNGYEGEVKDPETWNIAGALCLERLFQLADEVWDELQSRNLLSKNGNFSGIAMTGQLGGVTSRELFKGAGAKPAHSWNMPYIAPLVISDDEIKKTFITGILSKSGELRVTIEGPLAKEVYDSIEEANVSTVHFGKKGLAWLENMYFEE